MTLSPRIRAALEGIARQRVALIFGALIPLWLIIVAPQLLRLPNDFSYAANVISVDNFYDETLGDFKGEQYSKTQFVYRTLSHTNDVLLIQNTFDVQTLDGKTVFKTQPIYAINALTGAHVPTAGDRSREGYLFAPKHLQKGQSFTYWHADSDVPGVMKYVGEETLYGLPVYKYQTDYGGPVDQTANLSFLPGVPETRGVKLETVNELWVEPVTGYLVKQQDYSTDYYYYDIATGNRIAPYNKFLNTFSEESVREQVAVASLLKLRADIVDLWVPILFAAICLMAILSNFEFSVRPRRFIAANRVALLLLAFMVLLSVFVSRYMQQDLDGASQDHLAKESQEISTAISRRMEIYASVLQGAGGLFHVQNSISHTAWKNFVDFLKIQTNYPGIQGIGFAPYVRKDQLSDFLDTERANGSADYAVWPDGERELYAPVQYLEPQNARNARAMGFDMYSEPTRRKAMLRALESGDPTLSGSVTLVQENGEDLQRGFLMYLPVYAASAAHETVAERTQAISGFAYAPFRIKDFMDGIFNGQAYHVDFRIHDGLGVSDDSVIYATTDEVTFNATHSDVTFRYTPTVYVADHPWTLEFVNIPGYTPDARMQLVPVVFLYGGILFSFMVFFLIYSITRTKTVAANMAQQLTIDVKKGQEELDRQNRELQEKVEELNSINKLMIGRELEMVALKKRLAERHDSQT